jgi:hypothetical protein
VKVIDIEPLDVMGDDCYIPCIHMCFRRLGDFDRQVVMSLNLSLHIQYTNIRRSTNIVQVCKKKREASGGDSVFFGTIYAHGL